MSSARLPVHNSERAYIGGQKMPTPAMIEARDVARNETAEECSRELLKALLWYGTKHGLPNISREGCWDRLIFMGWADRRRRKVAA